MNKSALVVIPTIGNPSVIDAVVSVMDQSYVCQCLIVIDGAKYKEETYKHFPKDWLDSNGLVSVLELPWNTGANNFYGHRIYGAVSFLFDHDYLFYLDSDNWFERTHVQTMVEACENNNWSWCHSLRKIYDKNKNYICEDNCESLGKYPIYFNSGQHLVDTSTYCIRKEVTIPIAPAWYSGWGGDRRFFAAISQHFPNFGCTGEYTVNYRLDGNPGSVTADFFLNGNNLMKNHYPTHFPWAKK